MRQFAIPDAAVTANSQEGEIRRYEDNNCRQHELFFYILKPSETIARYSMILLPYYVGQSISSRL